MTSNVSKSTHYGSVIPLAKVAALGNALFNAEFEEKAAPLKAKLEELKKEGAPPKPSSDDRPKKPKDVEDDSDEMNAYLSARRKYQKAMDAYQKYVSDAYRLATRYFKRHTRLTKYVTLQSKMDSYVALSDKEARSLAKLEKNVADLSPEDSKTLRTLRKKAAKKSLTISETQDLAKLVAEISDDNCNVYIDHNKEEQVDDSIKPINSTEEANVEMQRLLRTPGVSTRIDMHKYHRNYSFGDSALGAISKAVNDALKSALDGASATIRRSGSTKTIDRNALFSKEKRGRNKYLPIFSGLKVMNNELKRKDKYESNELKKIRMAEADKSLKVKDISLALNWTETSKNETGVNFTTYIAKLKKASGDKINESAKKFLDTLVMQAIMRLLSSCVISMGEKTKTVKLCHVMAAIQQCFLFAGTRVPKKLLKAIQEGVDAHEKYNQTLEKRRVAKKNKELGIEEDEDEAESEEEAPRKSKKKSKKKRSKKSRKAKSEEEPEVDEPEPEPEVDADEDPVEED